MVSLENELKFEIETTRLKIFYKQNAPMKNPFCLDMEKVNTIIRTPFEPFLCSTTAGTQTFVVEPFTNTLP